MRVRHTSGVTVAYFGTGFQALAHRGGSYPGIGENSRRAFERAVEQGYTFLETDVHATSDGVLMAFHDESLDRVTDGHGLLTRHTAAELAEVRIGGTDPIPTLAELLTALPHARFNIDIKSSSGIVPLVRVLDECAAHDRVCVTSFSGARLGAFRRLVGRPVVTGMSQCSVALLAFTPRFVGRHAPGAAAQVPRRVMRGLVPLVTRRFVDAAHATGRRVHVWTINDAPTMNELIDLGVDGIVTDATGVLKDVLVARGLWKEAA